MDSTYSFGYWVRGRRRALDLTQDSLARQVGCAVPMIKKIEADERRPSSTSPRAWPTIWRSAKKTRGLPPGRASRAGRGAARPCRAAPPSSPPPIETLQPSRGAFALKADIEPFLFTDIEGRTRLWEQQPRAIPAVLARHDALLRQVIATMVGWCSRRLGMPATRPSRGPPTRSRQRSRPTMRFTRQGLGRDRSVCVRMALHARRSRAARVVFVVLNPSADASGRAHGRCSLSTTGGPGPAARRCGAARARAVSAPRILPAPSRSSSWSRPTQRRLPPLPHARRAPP